MAFKFAQAAPTAKITLKAGTIRKQDKTEDIDNEVGVNLTFDPKDGTLDGMIRIFKAKTELKTEDELKEAIEKLFNETLKLLI